MSPYLVPFLLFILGPIVLANILITYSMLNGVDEILRKVRALDRKVK